MTNLSGPHDVRTLDQLEALLGEVNDASRRKEVPFIHPLYRAWIEASPFVVLATTGRQGLDASPRGDPAGFVRVQGETTLLLPERPGNNRADSLRNILDDPCVALLFLIPGVGETLRVVGRARITTSPELMEQFRVANKLPKCVVVIRVEAVFFQCARAIHRARLWQPAQTEALANVPTPGAMLAALTGSVDEETYDREVTTRQLSTLY